MEMDRTDRASLGLGLATVGPTSAKDREWLSG
jgi:hypothetical protein